MLEINVKTVGETYALAALLAKMAEAGDVITLKGNLGVGKSEFSRAFIQSALGRKEIVPSPTFTILQQYEAPSFKISHFDLYRIDDLDELYELGFEEALFEGVTLIEWPEKLGDTPLKNHLSVEISAPDAGDQRTFKLNPDSSWQDHIDDLKLSELFT